MGINAVSCHFKRRLMRIYVFLLVLISSCVAHGETESFEQKMSKARYGELRAFERAELYHDLLKSINRGFASQAETREFATNVLGLLRQRPTSDVAALRALNDLVKSILASREAILQEFSRDFLHWKDVLEGDLARFALTDGDIVRVKMAHLPERALAVVSGEQIPRIGLSDSDGLVAFFKLALRDAGADSKTQHIVAGGGAIDVMPLYCDRSGVACALDDDYAAQFSGDVFAKTPEVVVQKCTKKKHLPFRVMKRDSVPAYTGEQVRVAHPGCGEWATVIERVSPEALAKLENDNLAQALERIRVMSTPLDKIRWLYTLRLNFNTRISEKNSSALFKLISGLMGQRDLFDHETLLAVRQLLVAYEPITLFKEQARYFAEWQRGINKLLEPQAIKFGDVVKISSALARDGALCVAPYVSGGATGFTKEIRLGLGPVHGSGHGHSLISLVSPVGKQGPIALGDEVELVLPHVDGSRELRCVLLPGDGVGLGRVLALNSLEVDPAADMVFIVDAVSPSSLSGDNKGAHLVGGEPFTFRSKKTQKYLGARRQLSDALWSMVEPFDTASSGDDGNIVQFCIDLMPVTAVANVVTKSFYDNLALIKREQSTYAKIVKIMMLLDTFSPKIETEDRDDFWDIVAGLLSAKKHFNEHELSKLIELVRKIMVVAKTYALPVWFKRARQAAIDLEFYKKVRRALSVPGMDRFKVLLELSPEVQNISVSEAQDFVSVLKTLRKYKKDQSRAAKLLLSQIEEEAVFDSRMTGSGNLLVP
jgi:hypothetical protein